jgi:hypothetical protein
MMYQLTLAFAHLNQKAVFRGPAFYLPKLTLVFLLWLSALTMEVTQEVNQVNTLIL